MNVTMRRTVAGALMALALLGAGIGVHWLLRVRSGPPPDVLPEPVAHTSIAPVWRPLNELDPSNEGYLAEVLSYMRQQLEGDPYPSPITGRAEWDTDRPLTEAEIVTWYRSILEWAIVPLSEGRDALLFRWGWSAFAYAYGINYKGSDDDHALLWFDPADSSGRRVLRPLEWGVDLRIEPREGAALPDLIYPVNDVLDSVWRWNGKRWTRVGAVEVIDSASWTVPPPIDVKDLSRFAHSFDIGPVLSLRAVRAQLRTGFGERYLEWLRTFERPDEWVLDVEEHRDGCLTMRSGSHHFATGSWGIVAICLGEGEVHAAFAEKGQISLVSPAPRYRDVPLSVRRFITEPEDRKDEPSPEKLKVPPRENFIWLKHR